MCVMNRIRGWLCIAPLPGRLTMRLPVCVGSGMRVLASSKRIASAGTPTLLERRDDAPPDRCLLAGDAFDGEEAHEAVNGGFDVDGMTDPLMSGACEHPSRRLASQGSSKRLLRVILGLAIVA